MGATESAVKSRLLYGRRKIEAKVRDLEKKGTKLYGLAPIPFLLWLLRGQDAYAAEFPDSRILQNVLQRTTMPLSGAGSAGGAGHAAGAAGASAGGGGAAAMGGLGAMKIALIAVAA